MYCREDGEAVCSDCCVVGGHVGHHVVPLSDAVSCYRYMYVDKQGGGWIDPFTYTVTTFFCGEGGEVRKFSYSCMCTICVSGTSSS